MTNCSGCLAGGSFLLLQRWKLNFGRRSEAALDSCPNVNLQAGFKVPLRAETGNRATAR
ncbi:hypothetical protein PGT21_037283 [Puccinia graminis f. sp. tritici]|uniref:Uncharacterized protein n=1 Tax=Puccinia graminis f. sp. tritici TaxID=56615 RepID=A0A5B0R5P9_PUCGR|nr:hypothetical protein PGT21_037283 [Puccinia graminis f. sp. tritici]